MIRVCKTFTFDAAHRLPDYKGKCKNLHGHTYKLEVEVMGDVLPENKHMVMDFSKLKKIVNENIIRVWDHRYLNEIFGYPTAEAMVNSAVRTLTFHLDNIEPKVQLVRVRLWETPDSYAEWNYNDHTFKEGI